MTLIKANVIGLWWDLEKLENKGLNTNTIMGKSLELMKRESFT